MTDVVSDDVFHEKTSQQDTDHRIEQIEVVGSRHIEIASQQMLDEMDQLLQDDSCRSGADSHQETNDQDKVLLLDVLLTPQEKAIE